MFMPDVNILVYAHRRDEGLHDEYAEWLSALTAGTEPFYLSVLVAVGFVRVVTNARLYADPSHLSTALAFIEELQAHPRSRLSTPGAQHLDDVIRLCRSTGAAGGAVADAQHAALAIAEGATWVTRDAGFARFVDHGLRWQHLVLE